MYVISNTLYLLCFLLYSEEERTDWRAHAGNVMDFSRHANQGYNGTRSSNKYDACKSNGCSDRIYADKQRLFSDEFMSGDYKRRREREEQQDYYECGRGMSQRSTRGMSHCLFASDPSSIDDPVGKYQEMMRLGYNTEDKEAAKMPEYISTPTPPPPLPITQDKYPYHQDTGSSEENEEKSRELL